MSREIKYRVWDNRVNKYWYWEFALNHAAFPKVPGGIYEQYTGLKDKNGVEIYEGDKLKWFNEMGWQHAEIVFKNGAFKAMVSKGYYYDAAILFSMRLGGDIAEIIGNIHTLDTNT